MQYRIIDGAHPDLKCTEYSEANLNSCCGPGISFTCISSGFALIPCTRRSRTIRHHLIKQYGDSLDKSGLTICIKTKNEGEVGHLNILNKSPEEYEALSKQLSLTHGSAET